MLVDIVQQFPAAKLGFHLLGVEKVSLHELEWKRRGRGVDRPGKTSQQLFALALCRNEFSSHRSRTKLLSTFDGTRWGAPQNFIYDQSGHRQSTLGELRGLDGVRFPNWEKRKDTHFLSLLPGAACSYTRRVLSSLCFQGVRTDFAMVKSC